MARAVLRYAAFTTDPAAGNPAGVVLDATGVSDEDMQSTAARVAFSETAFLFPAAGTVRGNADELDENLPPLVAYAGAWHPIIAARTRERLARLDYDFDALGTLMAAGGWTTINLVYRTSATTFDSRNPFPPGGVVEDPATGAAAPRWADTCAISACSPRRPQSPSSRASTWAGLLLSASTYPPMR